MMIRITLEIDGTVADLREALDGECRQCEAVGAEVASLAADLREATSLAKYHADQIDGLCADVARIEKARDTAESRCVFLEQQIDAWKREREDATDARDTAIKERDAIRADLASVRRRGLT